MKHTLIILFLIIFTILCNTSTYAQMSESPTADEIIQQAWDYMRDETSYAEVDMIIHRPTWERTTTINAWTKGRDLSIFFITAPPRDRGNGTLKKGREMWTYNPKIKRAIKIPPSMMSQSWMGSDFSNNDLAKADSVITDYTHTITNTEQVDGHSVYTIEALPKPHAPVVWGMVTVKIRDDFIILEETFYDEDKQPVKRMTTDRIETIGGKLYPTVWYMRKTDEEGSYTKLIYKQAEFGIPIPDTFFSLSNLKNPRRLSQ